MKFLIDNALSPLVAQLLRDAGHDATHLLLANLGELLSALERGAIVVIEPQRIRVRTLPIAAS